MAKVLSVGSVLDGPPIGGVLSYSLLLADLLEEVDCIDFSVITPDEPGAAERTVLERARVPLLKLERDWLRRADVLLVHNYRSHFLAAAAIGVRRARPSIVSVFHGVPIARPGPREFLKRRLDDLLKVVRSDGFVQVRAGCEAGRLGVNAPRRIIRNAGPLYVGRAAMDSARLRVGYVGRFSREKGVERIPTIATALLQRLGPDALHLRLYGEGPLLEPVVSSLPREVSVEQSVGVVDWKAIDVLVLPSHQEGSPMVIPEALASGCGVVATEVADDGGWPSLPLLSFGRFNPEGFADEVLKMGAMVQKKRFDENNLADVLATRRNEMRRGYRDLIVDAANGK